MERHSKVLTNIQQSRLHRHKVEAVTYVFGLENFSFLKSHGIQAEIMDHRPVVNFRNEPDRGRDVEGHVNYGSSMWRHKLIIIQHALARFGQVVWLDWDCQLMEPLPADFWQRMEAGAPFQAALTCYKKLQKAVWRPYNGWDRFIVPCGSFVYCRSPHAIKSILEIQDANPLWYDEICYALYTDQMTTVAGLWGGVQAYVAEGFQPYCAVVHRSIVEPERKLFYAPLRTRPHLQNREGVSIP